MSVAKPSPFSLPSLGTWRAMPGLWTTCNVPAPTVIGELADAEVADSPVATVRTATAHMERAKR
jgi:hypothetical protein